MTNEKNLSADIGQYRVAAEVDGEGNLIVRVFPRDKDGYLWDDPSNCFEVLAADVGLSPIGGKTKVDVNAAPNKAAAPKL